jgi:hypothetical protein
MRNFRTSPQAYALLQPAIDDAFRAEYIDSGRCEHILPPELAPMADGMCYIALPEWMTTYPGAEGFTSHPAVEEISEAAYQAAQPLESNV